MSDPDLEQLLQRARRTAPRPGSKERLRARILSGAAAAGIVAISVDAAGAGAGAGKAKALVVAVGKGSSGLVLSVLACVAGGVATGLWLMGPTLWTDDPPPRPQSPSVVVGAGASTPAAAPAPAPEITRPGAEAPHIAPPSRIAPPALLHPAEPAAPSIDRETALLAQAQSALRAGDAQAALRVLDLYDSEFPQGALSQEAGAQRIVSWCSLDRKAEGLRALGRFRTTYPGSPLLPRLTAACGKLESRDDFELESGKPSTQSGARPAPPSATARKPHEP